MNKSPRRPEIADRPRSRILAADLYPLLVAALFSTLRRADSPCLRRGMAQFSGRLAYLTSSAKRQSSKRGVRSCLGASCNADSIVRESFLTFWEDLFGTVLLDRDRGRVSSIECCGVEQIVEAVDRGRGAILWESNSFGFRALAKQALFLKGLPLLQVHAELHLGGLRSPGNGESNFRLNHLVPWLREFEAPYIQGEVALPRHGSLSFTRTLRRHVENGGILCSAADGQIGERVTEVAFFGRYKAFPTGMVSLARSTGIAIFPLFCLRTAPERYVVCVEEPLRQGAEADRDDAKRSTIRDFASRLEILIRRYPGQFKNWQSLDTESPASATLSPSPDSERTPIGKVGRQHDA